VQSNDVAITNNLAVTNIGASGVISTNKIQVQNDITCSTLNVTSSMQYNFKTAGFLTSVDLYGSIPLCKTIPNTANFCAGSLNLNAVFVLCGSIQLFLFPNYKLVLYDSLNNILFTADNSTGIDMGYYQIPSYIDVKRVIIYNNNVVIL
jgi:hypothetical protein